MLSNDHISPLDENLKKVGAVSGHMEFAANIDLRIIGK